MTPIGPGCAIGGFVLGDCIHQGLRARLYRAHPVVDVPPAAPLLIKFPCLDTLDREGTLLRFEVEQQTLRALRGPHAPRYVTAGETGLQPWLVMEDIEAPTLQGWLDQPVLPAIEQIVGLGTALAQAVHSLHRQDCLHLDLQPAHVLLPADGRLLLLGYGLARHAHYPDLLASRQPRTIGSATWMAPEQVLGDRGDPRSDVFAIGVILYQLLTRTLPFDAPETPRGLRRRLWQSPAPPRSLRPDVPAWLQAVVLRCLAPEAGQRYPSAAHLAFDLQNPQAALATQRAQAQRPTGLRARLQRWLHATRHQLRPGLPPARLIREVPIVLVAVPQQADDATLLALRETCLRLLGAQAGACLACVIVLQPGAGPGGPAGLSRRHLLRLHHWARPLEALRHQVSCQVLQGHDVAQVLLEQARLHQAGVIVLAAAAPEDEAGGTGVAERVVRGAACTVVLARPVIRGAFSASVLTG
jgi:hypothetical protein